MIKELNERPAGSFKELDEKHHWLQLYNEDCIYAYIALKFEGPDAAIHFESLKWTPGIVKQLRKDWVEVVNACKNEGAKVIIAANQDYKDTRWPKFIKLFGFKEPQIVAFSRQKI